MSMAKHKCDCGCTPPHSRREECLRNRNATQALMDRRFNPPAPKFVIQSRYTADGKWKTVRDTEIYESRAAAEAVLEERRASGDDNQNSEVVQLD